MLTFLPFTCVQVRAEGRECALLALNVTVAPTVGPKCTPLAGVSLFGAASVPLLQLGQVKSIYGPLPPRRAAVHSTSDSCCSPCRWDRPPRCPCTTSGPRSRYIRTPATHPLSNPCCSFLNGSGERGDEAGAQTAAQPASHTPRSGTRSEGTHTQKEGFLLCRSYFLQSSLLLILEAKVVLAGGRTIVASKVAERSYSLLYCHVPLLNSRYCHGPLCNGWY